jgi:hypothetical protein
MTFSIQAFVHPSSCDRLTTSISTVTTTSNNNNNNRRREERYANHRQNQLQMRKRKRFSTTTAFMTQPSDYSFLGGASVDHPLLLATTATAPTTTNFVGEPAVTSFEPILNVPALVTFLFITTIFTALILRTNQVEDAVRLRKQRLEELRILKSKEISNAGVGSGTVSSEDVQKSLHLYEDAVQQEETLRNIIPGVRIVPPSSNDRKEEEASLIAKQLLGKEYNIGREKRVDEYDDEEQQRNNNGKLPTVAIGILLMLGLSQVGLLAFLNFGFAADVNNSWFNKL